MRRRALLTMAAAACAGVPAATEPESLLDLFADPAQARTLGNAYLATLPSAPGPNALAAAIMRDLGGEATLRSRVAALIRRDFAAGRIECIDGWLLASTEARICGLAACAEGLS